MRVWISVLFVFVLSSFVLGQFETGWQVNGVSGRVILAPDGSIRVVGDSHITAMDRNGATLWSKPASLFVNDAAIDGQGNTYVAGLTNSSPYAARILSFDSNGALRWTYMLDTETDDSVEAVAVTPNAVFAAVSTNIPTSSGTKRGVLAIRLNRESGAVVWSKPIEVHPLATTSRAIDIVVGGQSVFVLGLGEVGRDTRMAIFRLNAASGGIAAVARPASSVRATGLAVDAQNQLYVASGAGLCRVDGQTTASSMPVIWTSPSGGAYPFSFGDTIYSSDYATIFGTASSGVVTPIYGGLPPENRLTQTHVDRWGRLYVQQTYRDGELSQSSYVFTALDPQTQSVLANEGGNYDVIVGVDVDEFGTTFLSAASGWASMVKEIYQRPEPISDVWPALAEQALTVAGPGVLANDKYTDPAKCSVTLVNGPFHGELTLGSDGGFTFLPDSDFTGSDVFRYRVTRGNLSGEADVVINVNRPVTLALSKSSVAGQNYVQGTVILENQALSPTTVTLQSGSPLVNMPASVTVATGQISRNFSVQVQQVSAVTVVDLRATLGSFTHTRALTLKPPVPTSLVFTPSRVFGGATVSARLVIDGVAGPAGVTVTLTSSSAFAQPPTSIVVPPGASSVTFQIPTTTPPSSTLATITASVPTGQKSAYLRIDP